jgi:pyridoxamine 5'-phosphate oxidase
MEDDPIARFQGWFEQARRADVPLPEAMALATVGRDGSPSVRFVLLKGADRRGFLFFTDRRSRKGRELEKTGRAAAVLYWDALGRQVRIEGRVRPASAEEADAYWETRPRGSRLAARASRQSARLRARGALVAVWTRLRRKYRGKPIARPADWTGFRIVPDTIEFWTRRAHRLHDRELFVRSGGGWTCQRLQP